MKAIFDEFKVFAMRGNVVDLAIAVVIGAAFGKIVTSFTNDIIMPILGLLTGGIDFSAMAWTLKEATDTAEAVTMGYGLFINSVISFLIIAFAVFVVMKQINRMKKQEEEAPAEPPQPSQPSSEEVLLAEIRDLLKVKK